LKHEAVMSIRATLLLLATFVIWVPLGAIQAEIYFLPKNVSDTAMRGGTLATDTSLPFIYLEPHEVCFDDQKPITVTVCAVNRSSGTLKFDWQFVLQALSLEPVGPGTTHPRFSPKVAEPCEVE